MDIQKFESYLKIKHSYYSTPSLEALNYYVRRFMITVPFENINVQNKIPISIDIKDLYNKIVIQRRGGFCYELNHLFATYLEHKGFHVTRAAATVHTPNGGRSLKARICHFTLISKEHFILLMLDLVIYLQVLSR